MHQTPLVVMVTFNRRDNTLATLSSVMSTTLLSDMQLCVIDNNSTDGTREAIEKWLGSIHPGDSERIVFKAMDTNIGCPRALNYALSLLRKAGQPVVKLDNDVEILSRGWLHTVQHLEDDLRRCGGNPGLIGAYYDGALPGRHIHTDTLPNGKVVHYALPIIGHAVWHSGQFMDAVGYFDVLAPEHVYGFEDLVMSHKATRLDMDTLVCPDWKIKNLQRVTSLGREARNDHVEAMRPLYNDRVASLGNGGPIYTDAHGQPCSR